jgi:hypothetical protein
MFHILLDSGNILTESMGCPPSWIIEDMHDTSQVGSRKFLSRQPVINMNPKLVFGCYFKFQIE